MNLFAPDLHQRKDAEWKSTSHSSPSELFFLLKYFCLHVEMLTSNHLINPHFLSSHLISIYPQRGIKLLHHNWYFVAILFVSDVFFGNWLRFQPVIWSSYAFLMSFNTLLLLQHITRMICGRWSRASILSQIGENMTNNPERNFFIYSKRTCVPFQFSSWQHWKCWKMKDWSSSKLPGL